MKRERTLTRTFDSPYGRRTVHTRVTDKVQRRASGGSVGLGDVPKDWRRGFGSPFSDAHDDVKKK